MTENVQKICKENVKFLRFRNVNKIEFKSHQFIQILNSHLKLINHSKSFKESIKVILHEVTVGMKKSYCFSLKNCSSKSFFNFSIPSSEIKKTL